jgi:cytochrome c2
MRILTQGWAGAQPRQGGRALRVSPGVGARATQALLCVLSVLTLVVGVAAEVPARDPEAVGLLKSKGCGACHVIPGVPDAMGTLGPSLKGLKERPRIAAGRLENTPERLREWLKNPKRIKSDTMMPNLGLEEAELDLVIRFLYSL